MRSSKIDIDKVIDQQMICVPPNQMIYTNSQSHLILKLCARIKEEERHSERVSNTLRVVTQRCITLEGHVEELLQGLKELNIHLNPRHHELISKINEELK